jgi:hypothetical protein
MKRATPIRLLLACALAAALAAGSLTAQADWRDVFSSEDEQAAGSGGDSTDSFWATESEVPELVPPGVPTSFADLAERVSPSVVNIRTSQTVTGFSGVPPQFEELFPFPFHGNGSDQPPRKREGAGSGLLDLNIHFSPGTGLTADAAAEDEYFANTLARMELLYRTRFGVALGEIQLFDLPETEFDV